jgi:nitrogen regulatory protein P-II 1
MRRLEFLLPPAKLDEVRESLAGIGVDRMTLEEVKVVDPASRRTEVFRGSEYTVDFALKVKMGLLVPDGLLPEILDALRNSLGPDEADQAEVLLSEVVEVMRLRPGTEGSLTSGHP